ncbi:hypothetical protein SAMN05192544_1016159 [Paraburkholderia hospita]|nr:hypothetical protein SAMN05192544_1016159 [Paraburkholderia hospita]
MMHFRDWFRKRSRAIAHARAPLRCSRGNQKARRQTWPVVHLSEGGEMSTLSSVRGRAVSGSAAGLVWLGFCWYPVWRFCVCAGIRVMPSCFTRRPCAGRHLLFFAAAKKSRQKKAANTASPSFCLRAPTRSYASRGNHVTHVRCQRSCGAPHPLHAPTLPHAVSDIPPPPRWQTVCRP